jgi:hypothetical protein
MCQRRHEALKGEITGLGGRLLDGYVTRAQYHVVPVLDVRTTTVRAYLPEEFGRLAAEVP